MNGTVSGRSRKGAPDRSTQKMPLRTRRSSTRATPEGEFFVTFDGQWEKLLKAGELIFAPNATIHNEGTRDKPTKLFAVYVLEKGKPLTSPVK